MYRLFALLLLASLSALSASPVFASDNAQTMAKAGIEAFKAGDLEAARDRFQQALNAGSPSRSVIYNLGVVYIKLEQYDEAKATFRRLIPTSQAALAYYNIGLAELKQNNDSAAKTAFKQVLKSEPKEKLRKLATAQLQRLAPDQPPSEDRAGWIGLLSVGGGYQSNIALFPNSAPESIDTEYVEAIAAASGYLMGSEASGLRANLNLYSRQYPSAHDFDVQVAKASGRWQERTSVGDWGVGLARSHIWRDQQAREQRSEIFSTLSLASCEDYSARCSFKIEATDVDPEAGFEAYQGQRYRFESDYRTRLSPFILAVRYRYEYNDRRDLQTESQFFDLSPQRHDVRGSVNYPMTPALSLKAEAGFRFSRYRQPHQFQTEQGTVRAQREDARGSIELSAAYRITRQVKLTLALKHLDNQSSIDRYEYERQSAALTTAFQF